MSLTAIKRLYKVPELDFWDICSHYQKVRPEYGHISYTLDTRDNHIVQEEADIGVVLSKINQSGERIRKYVARFSKGAGQPHGENNSTELVYRPEAFDSHKAGLSFSTDSMSKLALFKFEDQIYSNYSAADTHPFNIEFGKPCEVLSSVIDMRGFSTFCEQPNIESPYTCGLMSSFYHMVGNSVFKFPPELIKFAGDGVLAIWETSPEDRQVAIDVCVEGMISLNSKWQTVRRNPHFSHGAPEDIGVGISFGLASRLTIDNDYIGRPINIASRLCGVCPGGRVYIDKSVPSISNEFEKKDTRVRIKSYGDYGVWMISSD